MFLNVAWGIVQIIGYVGVFLVVGLVVALKQERKKKLFVEDHEFN